MKTKKPNTMTKAANARESFPFVNGPIFSHVSFVVLLHCNEKTDTVIYTGEINVLGKTIIPTGTKVSFLVYMYITGNRHNGHTFTAHRNH